MRELLPLVAIQNREIGDTQIRHVAPFGVGDHRAYLDAIDRNTKRWLLSGVLAPSRPLRQMEEGSGENCHGAGPDVSRPPGSTGPIRRCAAPGRSRTEGT
jgi:hypothetical protein